MEEIKSFFIYNTKIGNITIAANNKAITNLFFDAHELNNAKKQETLILKEALKQLNEYLDGKRKKFELKYEFKGTEFQEKVWKTLQIIPYGTTWSYKQTAKAIGNEKACRAVGMANNRNPIPIFIPCHRVIGADGSLVGFAGRLDLKKKLLDLEQKNL